MFRPINKSKKMNLKAYQNGKFLHLTNFTEKNRTKLIVPDLNKLSIDIENALKLDTEYVFKIRAIYAQGPGVFSQPCITKTLPEGIFQFFFKFLLNR